MIDQPAVTVEQLYPGILKVDGLNPNRMEPAKYQALVRSIERNGFLVPVVCNEDLVIADGEHRQRAAMDLGLKTIPVIRVHAPEVDRRILRQTLNKLRGSHDPALDAVDLSWLDDELDDRDLLASILGEDPHALSVILGEVDEPEPEDEPEDDDEPARRPARPPFTIDIEAPGHATQLRAIFAMPATGTEIRSGDLLRKLQGK